MKWGFGDDDLSSVSVRTKTILCELYVEDETHVMLKMKIELTVETRNPKPEMMIPICYAGNRERGSDLEIWGFEEVVAGVGDERWERNVACSSTKRWEGERRESVLFWARFF